MTPIVINSSFIKEEEDIINENLQTQTDVYKIHINRYTTILNAKIDLLLNQFNNITINYDHDNNVNFSSIIKYKKYIKMNDKKVKKIENVMKMINKIIDIISDILKNNIIDFSTKEYLEFTNYWLNNSYLELESVIKNIKCTSIKLDKLNYKILFVSWNNIFK